MKKLLDFSLALYSKTKENEILPLATQLTYRLIFSLFPFIIFLISLVGFFDISAEFLLAEVYSLFPVQIAWMVDDVIRDVVDTANPGILSTSLILSLFTVTNGFRAVMRGVNKAYGLQDTRNVVVLWIYCFLLVLSLALAMVFSLLLLIFGDSIYSLISQYTAIDSGVLSALFGFVGLLITITIMLATIILIYRLSCCKPQPIISLLPGAMLTLAVWAVSSSAFNFYVNNFSRYNLVYGTLAGIFITMLWLNILSTTILIGAQTNALLDVKKSKSR